ncbi:MULTISPECIES: hypothetical protein [Sorangium]|uniref:Uncharacterized protein n=1 Tax=Sorangium cellulosum TaxID=56 RepID=A0A4P2R264_SORCE|nr:MULTISPECIES: hypothetical protein [Sorangium]AUX36776.1 hypothetical protein SOCE836_089910 [Sorangium cellulosum]WCQ96074.1 hypothetical protein NQZ70_08857 [Sorangium sp. Soce836]
MSTQTRASRRLVDVSAGILAAILGIASFDRSARAQAQPEAPPPPTGEHPPVEAPASPPADASAARAPAAEAGAGAPTLQSAAGPGPASAALPPPADDELWKKPLSVAAWARVGGRLQNPGAREKMDRLLADGELHLLFSGEINRFIGVQGAIVAQFGPTPAGGNIAGSATLRDAIAKVQFHDLLNVWIGRMIVPSDRSAFSGPWSMGPWNYPGSFEPYAPPLGPRQGPFGRNDGVTAWGKVAGGLFKYYVGAYNLHDSSVSPLYTARLNLSLLDPEPAYYQKSTYLGEKSILALGVAGEVQREGSVESLPSPAMDTPPGVPRKDTYMEANADLLFEKNLGTAGTITLEGAFYKYFGDFERFDHSYFALASYLSPTNVGVGKLQPLVRLQQARPKNADPYLLVDAQVGYIIEGHAARAALGYQRSDLSGVKGNAVFLGVQLQK